jgi:GT2 family glycosyltransferase
VTAAVLNYNGRALLEVLLPSLAAQRYGDFAAVVVDNGSSDDTVSWLGENWPQVEIVQLPENVGVTAALNVCLRAGGGEFIVLLNNDIELDPGFLGELVSAMDAHPEAAAAAGKLLDFHDRTVLDGAGDVYTWSGEGTRRGKGERDSGQCDQSSAVFGACGGAAIYRRSAFRAVGPFDEQLFALCEDVDWSFRAQLLGYGCRYVPTAVAYHMGSATIGQGLSDFMLYHSWRNGIWVVLKNYPLSALVRYGHRFLLSQAHNLVWAMQTRRVGIFIRAWRDALRGMPAVLRKRRDVQRSRTVGLDELERVIGVDV